MVSCAETVGGGGICTLGVGGDKKTGRGDGSVGGGGGDLSLLRD